MWPGWLHKPNDMRSSTTFLFSVFFLFYGVFCTAQTPNWGLIDKTGKVIVPFGKYSDCGMYNESRCAVQQNGKWGFIDTLGNEVISCTYDTPNKDEPEPLFSNGMAWVKKRGKWGCIDLNGKIKIQFLYQAVNEFYNGSALVKKKNKWGFINPKGETLIPFEFSDAASFTSMGWAKIKKSGAWGIIDQAGKVILPAEYSQIEIYENTSFAKIQKDQMWGLVNSTGQIRIPCTYAELDYLNHAKVVAANRGGQFNTANNKLEGGNWGILSIEGQEIVAFGKYEKISLEQFPEHWSPLIGVKKKGKFGFVQANGNEVIPCFYDAAFLVSEHLVAANYGSRKDSIDWHRGVIGGKWGFLDVNGKEVLPFEYDGVSDFFSEKLILVNKGCQLGYLEDIHCDEGRGWGLIDHKGEEIIPCHYLSITGNYHGGMLAALRLQKSQEGLVSKKWTYLNENGEEIITPIYSDAQDFNNEVAMVNLNGKWGIINKTGEALSDFKYTEMCCQQERMIGIYENGKWGFINGDGKQTIDCKYERVTNFVNGVAWVSK